MTDGSPTAAAPSAEDLQSRLRACPTGDDAALADVVQDDGVALMRAGQPVSLDRYLDAIPNLAEHPEALDAAASVALAAAAIDGDDEPAESLAQRHPALASAIREAAVLNSAVLGESQHTTPATAPEPARPTLLPRDFGPTATEGMPRYKLVRRLGSGAFGEVFLAKDRHLSDAAHAALVAVKVLRPDKTHGRSSAEEAATVRRIDHPNVVRVLDRGRSQDRDYIVYEFLIGGSLARRITQKRPPWDPRRAVRLMAGIARGVQAAHSVGILHFDLKPSNILLAADGTPKIADFGVSINSDDLEAVRAGYHDADLIGNLAFISPEQFRRDTFAVGPASDVYATGGLLYFLLTGDLPNGRTREEVEATLDPVKGRREAPPVRGPGIDVDLQAICRRALSPYPANRHESAGEFASDLESWLHSIPIAWTNPGPVRLTRLAVRRNPLAAGMSVFLGLLVLFGAVVITSLAKDRRQASELAAIEAGRAELSEARLTAARDLVMTVFVAPGDRAAQRGVPEADRTGPITDAALNDLVDPGRNIWTANLGGAERLRSFIHSWEQYDTTAELLFETEGLFWKATLGGYMVGEERVRVLAESLTALDLEPDDPWLRDVQLLKHVFAANRVTVGAQFGVDDHELEEAERLEPKLLADLPSEVNSNRTLAPQHALTLIALAELYQPELLNRPRRQAETEKQLADLMNELEERARDRTAEVRRSSG